MSSEFSSTPTQKGFLKGLDIKIKQRFFCFIYELHSLVQFNSIIASIMLAVDYALIIILVIYVRIANMVDEQEQFVLTQLRLVEFQNNILYDQNICITLNLLLIVLLLTLFWMIIWTNPDKPRKKKDGWKIHILLLAMYFFNSAISNIVIYTQFLSIFCQQGVQNFTCIDESFTARVVISCMGFIAMILNSYFIEGIYNYQFMGINMQRSILSNYRFLSILPLALKYANILIYVSSLGDVITSTVFVCAALIYFIILFLRFSQSFYFSKILSDVEVIGLALCFYNYVISVSINILHYDLTNGDFFIVFGMNFIVGLFIYILRKYSWMNKLNQEFMQIKNKAQKEVFAYRMLDCITDNTFENQLILNGMLKLHKLACTNTKCHCTFETMIKSTTDDTHQQLLIKYKTEEDRYNADLQQFLENQQQQDGQNGFVFYQGSLTKLKTQQQLYYLLVLSNWLEISFQNQGNHRMRIIQSYLQSDLLDQDLKALFLISTLTNFKFSFSEKIAIFCYKRLIFDKVNNRLKSLTPQSLDVQFVMRWMQTEQKIKEFQQNIEITKNYCYTLWKSIQYKEEGDFNFEETQKTAYFIVKQCSTVDNIYRQIRLLYPDFLYIISIYQKFLKYIMNHEFEAQKEAECLASLYQKRNLRNIRKGESNDDIFDINTNVGVVQVDCNKKNLGKIIFINKELSEMTKNEAQKLKGRPIYQIMPALIDEDIHNQGLENFFLGQTKSLFSNKICQLWLKDQDGYIIPIDFYMQPFYEYQNGLQIIVFMKRIQQLDIKDRTYQEKDVLTIMTNPQGLIYHSNTKFAELLSFNNIQDLQREDLNVYDLFSEMYDSSHNIRIEELQKGIETQLLLNNYNEKVSDETIQSKNIELTVSQSQFSEYDGSLDKGSNIQTFGTKGLNELKSSIIGNKEFHFSKLKKVNVILHGEYFFLKTKYQFLVFNFVLKDVKTTRRMNLEKHLLENKEITETTQVLNSTDSGSSGSENSQTSNSFQKIKQNEIKLVPKLVGIFQKIFVVYFLIFAALSSAMIYISYEGVFNYLHDFEQFNLASEFYSQLIFIRLQFRVYLNTIKQNENKLSESSVISDLEFQKLLLNQALKDAQNYMMEINEYLLSNQDDSSSTEYNSIFKNKQITLTYLNSNGNYEYQQVTLMSTISSILSSLTMYLTQDYSSLICNCYFRGNLTGQTYTELQRFVYNIIYNSAHIMDGEVYNAITEIENTIIHKADMLQQQLLYFTIPSMILSILCCIAFFPVIIRTLNNSFKIIQMLTQLSKKSSVQCLLNLELFEQLIASESNSQSQLTLGRNNKEVISQKLEDQSNKNIDEKGKVSETDKNSQNNIASQNIEDDPTNSKVPKTNNSKITQLKKKLQNKKVNYTSIEQQINKRFVYKKIINSAKLIILSAIFCSFFVVMYFLNIEPLVQVNDNILLIKVFNERQACLQLLYFYIYEGIAQNKSLEVNQMSDSLDGLFDYCNNNLQQITYFRRSDMSSLSDLMPYLQSLENDQLCNHIDSENQKYIKNLTPCKQAFNGILTKGMSIAYSFLMGEFRSYYNAYQKSSKTTNSLNELLISQRFKIEDYSLLQVYLRPILQQSLQMGIDNFMSYYKKLMQRPIIFFVLFIIILLAFVITIICYTLRSIQREAFYNQKLIKFIPNEELLNKQIAKLIKSIKY